MKFSALILSLPLLMLSLSARSDTPLTPRIRPLNSKRAGRALIAPDIKAAALWDGRKTVEFHASNFPKMVKAADARFLIDDEYVLGMTVQGKSRAYPTRFVSWHHIINDKMGTGKEGATFFTITYCIVCNSGLCFETPQVHNQPLSFDFYGLYNGVMTMFDKQTNSVWLQVGGRAVKGPLLGTTLKPAPLLDTTWGEWKRLHPDTLVMAPDARFDDCYESKGAIMARGYTEFPAAYFAPTLTHRDTRLPMFASVLAVRLPTEESCTAEPVQPAPGGRTAYRAYPMKTFGGKTGVINEVVGKTAVTVLFQAGTETMSAVSPVVDGQILTLEAHRGSRGKLTFYDKETGTRWNIEGKAEEGPLAGRQLRRLDCHMSQWYGWVSYFPQTTIYEPHNHPTQVSLKSGS